MAEELLVTKEQYKEKEVARKEAVAETKTAPPSYWKKEVSKEEKEAGIERSRGLKAARGIARTGIKTVEVVGTSVLRGVGHVVRIKGVKHPDDLIDPRTKHLYALGNPKASPLGYKPTTHELYFGGRGKLSTVHGTPQARKSLSKFGEYQAAIRARAQGAPAPSQQVRGLTPEAQRVWDAVQQGTPRDQLEVVAGVTPQELSRSLQELRQRRLDIGGI